MSPAEAWGKRVDDDNAKRRAALVQIINTADQSVIDAVAELWILEKSPINSYYKRAGIGDQDGR